MALKLDERRRSISNSLNGSSSTSSRSPPASGVELAMDVDARSNVERRQLRQFPRADEYLYAMKEDLAEWFAMLYAEMEGIDADCFMDKLENGEHLVKVGHGRIFIRVNMT